MKVDVQGKIFERAPILIPMIHGQTNMFIERVASPSFTSKELLSEVVFGMEKYSEPSGMKALFFSSITGKDGVGSSLQNVMAVKASSNSFALYQKEGDKTWYRYKQGVESLITEFEAMVLLAQHMQLSPTEALQHESAGGLPSQLQSDYAFDKAMESHFGPYSSPVFQVAKLFAEERYSAMEGYLAAVPKEVVSYLLFSLLGKKDASTFLEWSQKFPYDPGFSKDEYGMQFGLLETAFLLPYGESQLNVIERLLQNGVRDVKGVNREHTIFGRAVFNSHPRYREKLVKLMLEADIKPSTLEVERYYQHQTLAIQKLLADYGLCHIGASV